MKSELEVLKDKRNNLYTALDILEAELFSSAPTFSKQELQEHKRKLESVRDALQETSKLIAKMQYAIAGLSQ